MKTYTRILFDWDGCLAKSLDIALYAYKVSFRKYDISLSDKKITHEVFGDWQAPQKLGIRDITQYWEDFHKILNKTYSHVPLYEHVQEVLTELKKRKKKLALVSSSRRSTLNAPLTYHKLYPYFDVIMSVDNVKKDKPNPEIVYKTLRKLRAGKSESLLVGDSKNDLLAAKSASVDSVLFYPKHNQLFYDFDILKTYDPTYIISDLRELLTTV